MTTHRLRPGSPPASDPSMAAPPRAAADYRVLPASWRDVLALYRLERLVFPRDTYSPLELFLLLLWPGLVNLKAVAPDGAAVGFISGGRLPGGRKTWIVTLGVHPAHQRRGLGRLLLETCESRLDARTLYLTVRQSNAPALALYRHTGYRQVQLKPGYYPGGETGIEMRKDRW